MKENFFADDSKHNVNNNSNAQTTFTNYNPMTVFPYFNVSSNKTHKKFLEILQKHLSVFCESTIMNLRERQRSQKCLFLFPF